MRTTLTLFCFMLVAFLANAQTPAYYISLSTSGPTVTSGCFPFSTNVSGSSRYWQYVSDPPGYDPCPLSTVRVDVQRWNGSGWVYVTHVNTTISNPNFSINFNPPATGTYQLYSSLNAAGSTCPGSVAPATYGLGTITVNTAASSTYQVNGNNVNTTTYLQVCDGGSITMDNIIAGGTNSSYQWRVGASRNGSPPVYGGWTSGVPSSSYNLKNFIQSNFPGVPLAADYDVYLQTKNICNSSSPHTYTGKIRIVSSGITIQFQTKNNSTGTPLATVSSSTSCAAPHTSFCLYSTIIAANQSSVPTLINGQWACKLEYVPVGSCNLRNRAVFDKPFATLTNLNDLASLDLNALATTVGGQTYPYVTNNSSTHIWYFELTIKNQCNSGGVTAGCWLRNVNIGCKTSEGDNATNIFDPSSIIVDNDWTFYPNPASGLVNILWQGNYAARADIRVFDLLGKQVNLPVEVTGERTTIDVSNLAKGQYILYLNGSGFEPRMLVVE